MITYASINEKGNRPYQEDNIGVCTYEKEALFVVADGLGGHGMGNVASKEMVELTLGEFHRGCEPDLFFSKIFVEGNQKLQRIQDDQKQPNGMKTTLVCALIQEEKEQITGAYVGDSRMYVFKRNRILFRSLDHSVPQMLVSAGELKETEIRNHPDRNRLLRVLGDREREVRPQMVGPFEIRRATRILLCTDGFWEYVREEDMERTLKNAKNPEEWMRSMKWIVKKRGIFKKQDNYSAIGIWVS